MTPDRTNVIFACTKCGEAYVCTQERRRTLQTGICECPNCHSTVHHWSGPYTYREWQRFNPRSTR